MSQTYNLTTVRKMLSAAFGASGISTAAFDISRSVYDNFTTGMTKDQKVRMLVDHAYEQGKLDTVVTYIKKNNEYQFNRFKSELFEPPPSREPTGNVLKKIDHQRLKDINRNIDTHAKLLAQYEANLILESDPRRMAAIEANIEREKEALTKAKQEIIELQNQAWAGSTADVESVQQQLADMNEKLDGLSDQLTSTKDQLVGEHQYTRDTLYANHEEILAKIGREHAQTLKTLVAKLDENQTKNVTLLLDIVDRQEIAQWEGQQLTMLAQQAMMQLQQLNEGGTAETQKILAILEGDTDWSQKLKLCLPIVPGLVSFESEVSGDLKNTLKEVWQRLTSKA